jgi:hypothetical protein
MEKKEFEELKNYYLKLGNELHDSLKSYSIEESTELALKRFDMYLEEKEIYEKTVKAYREKDEISKKVLTFQKNRCKNNLRFYENLIVDKFNDMPYSPNKVKLEKKINNRKIEKPLFDPKLRVEITPEELLEMPIEKRIKYHMANYDLCNLIMSKLREILKEYYKKENIKRYKIAFLEYDYNLLKEESCKSYEQACYNYFLELPLDYPRKQIKESITGSKSLFHFPALENLLFVGEEGNLFKDIYCILFPDSEDVAYDEVVYVSFSNYSSYELVHGNLDIIDIIRSGYSKFPELDTFNPCLDKIPSDIFKRREELLLETIKAKLVYFKEANIRPTETWPLTLILMKNLKKYIDERDISL